MLASWRGARLEVIQVLREVLDHVLKEPGVSDSVMYTVQESVAFRSYLLRVLTRSF